MDKLGIKEGNIIKVTGKDSVIAFCFSANLEEIEKAKSQDPSIECLNPDHKEIEYPRIIMSSPVYCNTCPSKRLRLVGLKKLSTLDFKNQVSDTDVVTMGTMKFAENAMPYYKGNIDFSSLFGQFVKKQERANVSFLPDFAQKYLRTSRGGWSHLLNFSFMIINVKPEDHDFWFVTKNIKFEFQDIPMEKFKGKIGNSRLCLLSGQHQFLTNFTC